MKQYKIQFTDRRAGHDIIFFNFFARRDAVARFLEECIARGEYAAVFEGGRDITSQFTPQTH